MADRHNVDTPLLLLHVLDKEENLSNLKLSNLRLVVSRGKYKV